MQKKKKNTTGKKKTSTSAQTLQVIQQDNKTGNKQQN